MNGLGRLALIALGVLAYKNRDKLGELVTGGGSSSNSDPNSPNQGGLLDQLRSGGLGELLERFRGAGKGSAVDSWVGSGPNEPLDKSNVEAAIDPETLDSLSRQTGLSREEILERLAINLPEVVNDLTPEGHLPEERTTEGEPGRPSEPTLLDPVPPRKG
ncbi:YidB family protein [Kumtagia ephedrae]|uniref:DUF937 domain-containing protein n=1 Tax=Kumtagia ephedrae TaxID=2116701 RepID=A0A2P7SPV2_9HYPH|nr:YidB family protein [Mesorhizobium ephedrae]PSJ64493.1 hypothetical protein C7I84_05995 [Mesorhizobium ephedrae]